MPLRHLLAGHDVITAFERGWSGKQNGDLLLAAEADGFGAFITTDQNLRYQQNLEDRRLAVLVLMTTDWRAIRARPDYVLAAVGALSPGEYRELPFPPSA